MNYTLVSSGQITEPYIKDVPLKETFILDFGDTYLIDQFLASSGLKLAIDAIHCRN